MASPIIDPIELEPKRESLAKARPVQSGELKEYEVFEVYGDREFKILSYDVADNGHYKCKLDGVPHPALGDTVYLFADHFEVFPQDLDVLAAKGTWLKADPGKMASDLPDDQKLFLPHGSSLIVHETGEFKNNCVLIELEVEHGGKKQWWAYFPSESGKEKHIQITGCEPENIPRDEPAPKPRDMGKALKVPGVSARVFTGQPVDADKAPNITWGEMTKGGARIPTTQHITFGMIKIAREMQKIRAMFGDKPLIITSGYRPPRVNRAVGGARFSRHTDPHGDAVDFRIPGVGVHTIYNRLESYWGNKGGLAYSPGMQFVHIDLRGVASRWRYPR